MSSANGRWARLATARLGSATEGEENGSATERGAANGFSGGWVLSLSSPLGFESYRSGLGFEFLRGGRPGSATERRGGDWFQRRRRATGGRVGSAT
ncbi:hypothetical protein TIFTF001_031195 [Ficus carica]|uniref:Uncharacterized protein n=1 Tax=Ficus carica TaxID=3494 RepID=A0AA88J3W1_FICCA|nr:hypothetical protein TIFTF001_031195 [Ficus carica]